MPRRHPATVPRPPQGQGPQRAPAAGRAQANVTKISETISSSDCQRPDRRAPCAAAPCTGEPSLKVEGPAGRGSCLSPLSRPPRPLPLLSLYSPDSFCSPGSFLQGPGLALHYPGIWPTERGVASSRGQLGCVSPWGQPLSPLLPINPASVLWPERGSREPARRVRLRGSNTCVPVARTGRTDSPPFL